MEDPQHPEVPGYTVGRLLGRGGSASVWLVQEQQSGRDYALKCFGRETGRARGGGAVTGEAVRREIRILSVLDHQHLIKAHHPVKVAGPHAGTALVMDYAPGGSLAELVAARGRLTVGETVTVLTPIAQALGYLHGKGFTHSDVSPGNVLFTGQGKPMLSDLGIARMLGDPKDNTGHGTPGFLDPAPVDAVRAGLQPERDVYSTAALGWYCLTGEPPARTADRPPLSLLVPGVPPDLAAALEAGLNEDRRLRPDAMALATAVYRSAAPLPLDLAASVHPTVMPELLTRRQVPRPSWGNGLKRKFEDRRRRLAVSGWAAVLAPRSPMPYPEAEPVMAGRGNRGRHAAGLQLPAGRRRSLGRASAAALAGGATLAAAVLWWAAAGPPPEVSGTKADIASPPAAGKEIGEPLPGSEGSAVDLPGSAREQAQGRDPAEALKGLAALRDHALSTGELELLAEVNAEGSPAAAADQRISDRLEGSGHVLAGFSSSLSDLETEEGATGARAVVGVTAATSSYQETDPQGGEATAGNASPAQRLRMVMVWTDGAWRISEILPGA